MPQHMLSVCVQDGQCLCACGHVHVTLHVKVCVPLGVQACLSMHKLCDKGCVCVCVYTQPPKS